MSPHTAFREHLSHEGIDVIYVVNGNVVLDFNGTDYPIRAGECCVYSAAYPHLARNDDDSDAVVIAFTTGRM